MSDIHDAAALISNAETAALTALAGAVTAFEAATNAAIADLDYPESFASNAKRIAGNLLASLIWPKGDLNNLVAPVAATPTTPST